MITWAYRGVLARSARPGYRDEGPATRKEDVEHWLAEVKSLGVRAVICLLNEELEWYRELGLHDKGLLEWYKECGLEVRWVPVSDGRHPPVPVDALEQALEAFDALPKPLIVHCKAGVDRTGAVIDHICRERLSG